MTDLVFPPVCPSLPIYASAQRFPVRRIFCVGRNYAEHAREMGNDERDPPFFFTKPADAVVESGRTLNFPCATQNLHHEAELVVAIAKSGRDIQPLDADGFIWGYAAGNDLTRRDVQAVAKAARRPWDMGKGFDESAVIGQLHQTSKPLESAKITCKVDGQITQSADIADMTWPVRDIIAALSTLVTLHPGDLIMTGTPAGVGPIKPGQTCLVEIAGLSPAVVTYRGG